MNSDYYLVLGVLFGVLSLPALLSAYSEGRSPRAAAVLAIAAGGFILAAIVTKPTGYSLQEVPIAFTRVFAHILN